MSCCGGRCDPKKACTAKRVPTQASRFHPRQRPIDPDIASPPIGPQRWEHDRRRTSRRAPERVYRVGSESRSLSEPNRSQVKPRRLRLGVTCGIARLSALGSRCEGPPSSRGTAITGDRSTYPACQCGRARAHCYVGSIRACRNRESPSDRVILPVPPPAVLLSQVAGAVWPRLRSEPAISES
jgi:hypothetical protein